MSILSSSFGWQSAAPLSLDPTQVNNSGEYNRYSSKRVNKHRWGWDLHLALNSYSAGMELYAFLVSLGGTGGAFLLPNPLPQIGSGSVVGNATTRALIAKGDTSAPVDSLNNSQTGVFKIGDFVRFNNHSKVYMVTSQLNSNGTGQGTFSFYPPSFESIPDNTIIHFGDDVEFHVALESDTQDILIAISNSNDVDPKINVVEVSE